MISAVIFDVDGTLVDSVDLHANAWRDAFAEASIDIPFDEIRSQIGKGGDQLLPVFLDDERRERLGPGIEKRRGEIVRERYLDRIKAFPKVRDLFERLRLDGVRIALASSAKQDELQTYKRIARIDDLVDIETSSDDVERSKPHPDIFHAALKRLEAEPHSGTLVIGDTPYDAQAAGKAGLRTVGLLCGGFSEASLKEARCIAIYADPADLLANYDASPIVE